MASYPTQRQPPSTSPQSFHSSSSSMDGITPTSGGYVIAVWHNESAAFQSSVAESKVASIFIPVSWNSGPDAGSPIDVGFKRRHLASRTKERAPKPPDGLAKLRARANPGDSRHTAAHGHGQKTNTLTTSARNSTSIIPSSSTLVSSTKAPTKPGRHPEKTSAPPSKSLPTPTSGSASSGISSNAQSSLYTTGSSAISSPRPTGRPQKTPNPTIRKHTHGGKSNATEETGSVGSNQTKNSTQHASRPTARPQHGVGRILQPVGTNDNETSANQTQPSSISKADNATAATSANATEVDYGDDDYIIGDGGDTTSDAASPSGTSSSDDSQTSSGSEGPAYNFNKLSCKDYPIGVTAEEEWSAVDGDNTVQAFVDMYNGDRLFCYQCFNKRKDNCDDKSASCARGIKAASQLQSGSDGSESDPSWSIGAALFAQYKNAEGFTCKLGGNNPCSSPPTCENCNNGDGAGSSAILKSIGNAYTSFQKTHDAVSEARDRCNTKMNRFSDVFAPVPDGEGEAMALIIITSLFGGMLGFLPGIGGAIGGMAAGLGTGIGMEKYFSSRPGPSDTSASLGTVVDDVLKTYSDMMDGLFTTGEYKSKSSDGRSDVHVTLQDMMSGGALVHPDGDWETDYDPLVDKYQKIFFQQLALITWQNLEPDKKKHAPFITFEKGACDKVDKKKTKLQDSLDHDSQIDFQGDCYYLLDAYVDESYSTYSASIDCTADKLPGATNKDMSDNSDDFKGLTLGDFIIPSVLGWQNHSNQNGYESSAANGNLIKDPQAAGVVNIPVCDYEGNYEHPGIGCPKLGSTSNSEKQGCDLIPKSEGKNLPGQYQFGTCKAHVQQWTKLALKNNANQLPDYQIQVDIYDTDGRAVGSATKQDAKDPLEVSDTNLPFNLIVVPGGGDDDPMNFWYADQYWDSSDKDKHKCSVGKYNDGSHYDGSSRQMDCNFDCPLAQPNDNPPKSATIDHPLPNPAIKAYPGPTNFVNTYSKPPAAEPTAPSTPDYATGVCGMHITQYQRNEKDSNPTNDYQLEVNVKDAKGAEAANLPKMSAPQDKPLTMNGLKSPMTIRLGGYKDDKAKGENSVIYFAYDGKNFDTESLKCHKGGYEDGNRDMDCNFDC
ncbi:MAG: hypothetical protein Q9203_003054 [Teloschistes exilis]